MKLGLLITIIFCLFFSSEVSAQEVIPTYADYLTDNLYLLHPSMAGASNYNKVRLTARQQWFDVNDAPSLQTVSIHARVGEKVGIGGIVFNDKNGNYSKQGAYATFAYHLLFSRSEIDLNQLSFGISAGIIQHNLDQSGFTEYDPVVNSGKASDKYGNLDIGMSYYNHDFYAHLTAKNLISVNRELFYSNGIAGNLRKYLFSTGYVYSKWNSPWSFEPSILFQMREATAEKSIDLNFKTYRSFDIGDLWGGISFRRSFEGAEYTTDGVDVKNQKLQHFTSFVGFEYNQFLFAYTYTLQINSIVLSNNGFHQITLGYNFGKNRERYECNCPAIN
jgi:type IX secretion system PorP/SprF family membrane protein